MQPCGDKQYTNKQEWSMNTAGQFSLTQSKGKSCIDTDATVRNTNAAAASSPRPLDCSGLN